MNDPEAQTDANDGPIDPQVMQQAADTTEAPPAGNALTPAEIAAAERDAAIAEANANRVERQARVAAEEAQKSAEVAAAPPSDPFLVGFLAISATGGQKDSRFPGRMVAFPVMPAFGHEKPLEDLIERIRHRNPDGSWRAFEVVVRADGTPFFNELEGPPEAWSI